LARALAGAGRVPALFALGAGLAWRMDKTYAARASLLVRLGQEYVYQPRAGADPQSTTAANINEVIQSEREILTSAGLRQRVIDGWLSARLPGKGRRWRAASPARAACCRTRRRDHRQEPGRGDRARAQHASGHLQGQERRWSRPGAQHPGQRVPDLSREVFADVTLPAVTRQREAFETQLAETEAAIRLPDRQQHRRLRGRDVRR
jgi:hypothetical protein